MAQKDKDDNEALFQSIDRMIENIDRYRRAPAFDTEYRRRQSLSVPELATNNIVLRNLAHIIAFAHADSERVKAMVDSGVYADVWHNFDVATVSKLNPCDVAEEHWGKLSATMSRAKTFYIVSAARTLQKLGPFAHEIDNCNIPKRVQSGTQLDEFWKGFRALQRRMKELDIPYLKSTTSLLHLLLHLGYDCIKPDVIVMRTAERLKIVSDTKKDSSLKKVAKLLQEYSISREIRPSIVDMYFLIQEGQSEAKGWVMTDFKAAY
jgi:hypothetical protein